jgi:hypothetical protein
MDSSSYGTSDHAGQVTPPSCVGVVSTGEQDVYGTTISRQSRPRRSGNSTEVPRPVDRIYFSRLRLSSHQPSRPRSF